MVLVRFRGRKETSLSSRLRRPVLNADHFALELEVLAVDLIYTRESRGPTEFQGRQCAGHVDRLWCFLYRHGYLGHARHREADRVGLIGQRMLGVFVHHCNVG